LGRAARARTGRGGQLFLRAGGTLASGDADDLAPARGLRRRDATARPLRGPDGGGPRLPGRDDFADTALRGRRAGSAPRPALPGPPARASPPLVLPAAPLAHRSARTGLGAVPHPGRAAGRRTTGLRGAGAEPVRDRAAS